MQLCVFREQQIPCFESCALATQRDFERKPDRHAAEARPPKAATVPALAPVDVTSSGLSPTRVTTMDTQDLELITGALSTEIEPYFPDREAVWLLARMMPLDVMRVADLRDLPVGRLLNRPLVKALLADTGGGLLARATVQSVASGLTKGPVSTDLVYSSLWQDYQLTLDTWGVGAKDWQWRQMSRPGGNLVLRIGFPSEHGPMFGRIASLVQRRQFECSAHPVARSGRPTLAWVRLDIDLASGVALIEEVQSDWFKYADWICRRAMRCTCRVCQVQAKEMGRYCDFLQSHYARNWSRVAMLAALRILCDECGVRNVFMHTPRTGEALKTASGPRALYVDLPRKFAFQLTRNVPDFLWRRRRRTLKRILQSTAPAFWWLTFPQSDDLGRRVAA